ncbi:MAG TPA: sulfatase [Candidatus Binatia bacterium]|jgi:arylsulfatase A-like enzyme|nr:sulfatase [Candidatus Binatia bacterium]
MRQLLVAAVAAMAAVAWFLRPSPPSLPPTLVVEETVLHLSDTLAPGTVQAQDVTAPVRAGALEAGDRLREGGGSRQSLVAPPPARLGFHLDAPADAALRFDVGIDGAQERDDGRSGVRFWMTVNGREVWTRTVNPAATRRDRRWFDERVALPAGNVDVVLGTDAAAPSLPLAGTPGWGHVRLVRAVTHPRQTARADAPNVLVLLVDTLRADRVGVFGAAPNRTPTLDALARTGLVFEQMVAQSSWTLPSVATLFTGLHPRSHGALGSPAGDHGARWGYLSDRVTTWAEAASRAGITTVGISTNPLVSRGTNLAQGFETFTELGWSAEERNWPAAADVNARFLDWLATNRAQRFVAYLHYMEPHDPYTPPANLRPPVPDGVRPAIAAGRVSELAAKIARGQAPPLPAVEVSYLRALYDGEVTAWDRALAGLLDGLQDLGVRDDTIIVVTADHGEEFQEHGRLTHATQLYDESLRVPLVIVGPSVPAGRVIEPAQGIDLFPTLAHLLQLPAPEGLPGHDLLQPLERREVVSETASAIAPDGTPMDLLALRAMGWKLIDAPRTGRRELYDLGSDPHESMDRAADAPENALLAERLSGFLATARPPPRIDGADPGLTDKLKTLGYVE